MPNAAQKQALLNAITQIRSAEQLLVQASRATSDAATLLKINTEYIHLDSYLSQLLHTLAIVDEADFLSATQALKKQATGLVAEEAQIKKIIADVGTEAKIAGYIAQAATLMASAAV